MNWENVLGKPVENTRNSLLLDLDMAEEKKTYSDGITYYCFYSKGIAIAVTKAGVIDSVDFYKFLDTTKNKYRPADEKLLPQFIQGVHTGLDLVNKFGEPLEKGGGGANVKSDIWLRWESFEVVFSEKLWDTAKDVQWTSLTVFS
jgi:hypothetical protein